MPVQTRAGLVLTALPGRSAVIFQLIHHVLVVRHKPPAWAPRPAAPPCPATLREATLTTRIKRDTPNNQRIVNLSRFVGIAVS